MKKIITIVCVLIVCLTSFPQKTKQVIAEDLPPLRFDTYQEYGEYLVKEKWGESEWLAFKEIINRESSWIHTKAHYQSGYTVSGVKSSAHGLGGFLDATWSSVGCVKTDDGFIQVECTLKYIEQRYGTPTQALAYHNKIGHY